QKLTLDRMDVIELNEAFASQVLACDRDLGFDRERLNVNGGGVSLGHPTRCSGGGIVVPLLPELARRGGGHGVAPLCGSGGPGAAAGARAWRCWSSGCNDRGAPTSGPLACDATRPDPGHFILAIDRADLPPGCVTGGHDRARGLPREVEQAAAVGNGLPDRQEE